MMSNDRLIRVSKYLAKYLRHAPHELGLTLLPGGWVPADDLLAACRHGASIFLKTGNPHREAESSAGVEDGR